MKLLKRNTIKLLIFLLCLYVYCPSLAWGQDDELFKKIWDGIQNAQQNYNSAWGKIIETRTSKLFKEPFKFCGEFYAMNPDRFCLEYHDPQVLKIIYNAGRVTIIFKREEPVVEIFEVEKNVERTKYYFSGKDSYKTLSKDFNVTVKEGMINYEIKMVPEKERFKKKINYISIWLNKKTYLPNQLEIDGTSGVNSVFSIDIVEINEKIEDSVFMYKQH